MLRLLALTLAAATAPAHLAGSVASGTAAADFPLVRDGRAATLVVSSADSKVVTLAAHDLARDITTITGVTPAIVTTPCRTGPSEPTSATPHTPRPRQGQETPPHTGALSTPRGEQSIRGCDLPSTTPRVLIGTLGCAPAIDAFVATGALDISDLRGAWESFLIATLPPSAAPQPTLVIVGSDRRGTAFGVYELSQQIGVSPWHWWADVPPEKRAELLIPAGARRFGPPSVKYRGIFLNDEDWGLQPWAAKTFEPEHGDIGPRTYAKIFELLLRLKANTLWPAMHACTRPFNADPRHAELADDYAIVMGSSHAEPMLRNNVGEWPRDRHADYNYMTNRNDVRTYWEERVRTNARYENLWTLGMRGIHDSAIQGATADAERMAVLEQVFADQRAMLAAHVPSHRRPAPTHHPNSVPAPSPTVEEIPQIFCAYKEVLALYRQGLRVPDDVTIVWPDDNFGYVRNFATPDERTRSGGFGVYYHLSYLGRPLAYLWLNTTPPALIWSEMTKSYAHGADRVWIVNVGDLKPAEIGTEFFLRLAWDINQWDENAQPAFLREWAAREFGSSDAEEIAAVLGEFYTLNFARKPEHLQWWLPFRAHDPTNHDPAQVRTSDFTDADITARLAAFAALRARTDRLIARLPRPRHDAFFQLVAYPVHGAALANVRYFLGERGEIAAAHAADAQLRELTHRYNEEIAGGKWRGFMRQEPADEQWRSMRIAPWSPPESPRAALSAPTGQIAIAAADAKHRAGETVSVAGLGRTGRAVTLSRGAELVFTFDATAPAYELTLELLPTHPLRGDTLSVAIALNENDAGILALPVRDGGREWAQGVLTGFRPLTVRLHLEHSGLQTLHLRGLDAGVVLDRIVLTPAQP